jgi:O-antigen/teichoic acid export membrane protein
MANPTHDGTFRRNVKWQLVGTAGQVVLSALLLLLMGRGLGTAGFGVFSIVMSVIYVINLLFEPRLQDIAANQHWNFNRTDGVPKRNEQIFTDLFIIEILSKLLPCFILILLAPLLAKFANLSPDTSSLIILAATGTYLSKFGNGLFVGVLRVLGRSDLSAYCAIGDLSLRLILTLLIIQLHELTVFNCILVLMISGILSNSIQWWLVMKQLDIKFSRLKAWKSTTVIEMLKKKRRLFLSNLGLSASDLMNKDLDITLIASLLPSDQVGVYKMSKNMVLLTWRAVDPFYLALMPEVNRLVLLENFAGVKRLLVKSSFGLLGLAVGLSVASYILVLFFGGTVLGVSYFNVPNLMPWMLAGIVFSAPLVWGHPLAVSLNRADIAFVGSLIGSFIGFFVFLILTPIFGLKGAATAWAIALALNFMFTSGASYYLYCERARKANLIKGP